MKEMENVGHNLRMKKEREDKETRRVNVCCERDWNQKTKDRNLLVGKRRVE